MSSRTFEARYGGRCAACDERVHEGDSVRFVDDQIVHADCEAAAPRAEVLREPCPRCFMVPSVSGACECDA